MCVCTLPHIIRLVLYIHCIHGSHPGVISPGGIGFISGCVSNSCFLWTISLHCDLSLCQSCSRVMIMKLVQEVYFVVHEEGRGKLKLHVTSTNSVTVDKVYPLRAFVSRPIKQNK